MARDTGRSITKPVASHTALPAARAFVIQLRADADPARGLASGRVEHVLSGMAAPFESLEQLVAFMGNALAPRAPRR